LFDNIQHQYDLIITNPPYATTAEYLACPPEFKNEPRLAIESGRSGLDITHRILGNAGRYLNPQGKLIAEVGYSAAKRLKKRYRHIPFQWFKYRRPSGKESLFGMHGVFLCEAKGLPR
jgi:ribosomal protein L3 glutamine methyltransferase